MATDQDIATKSQFKMLNTNIYLLHGPGGPRGGGPRQFGGGRIPIGGPPIPGGGPGGGPIPGGGGPGGGPIPGGGGPVNKDQINIRNYPNMSNKINDIWNFLLRLNVSSDTLAKKKTDQ